MSTLDASINTRRAMLKILKGSKPRSRQDFSLFSRLFCYVNRVILCISWFGNGILFGRVTWNEALKNSNRDKEEESRRGVHTVNGPEMITTSSKSPQNSRSSPLPFSAFSLIPDSARIYSMRELLMQPNTTTCNQCNIQRLWFSPTEWKFWRCQECWPSYLFYWIPATCLSLSFCYVSYSGPSSSRLLKEHIVLVSSWHGITLNKRINITKGEGFDDQNRERASLKSGREWWSGCRRLWRQK